MPMPMSMSMAAGTGLRPVGSVGWASPTWRRLPEKLTYMLHRRLPFYFSDDNVLQTEMEMETETELQSKLDFLFLSPHGPLHCPFEWSL
ncbi:hypothetical protein ACLKA7_006359 [Drosophila subpalustris]